MKSILAIGIYIMKYFFGNSVILVNCSRTLASFTKRWGCERQ